MKHNLLSRQLVVSLIVALAALMQSPSPASADSHSCQIAFGVESPNRAALKSSLSPSSLRMYFVFLRTYSPEGPALVELKKALPKFQKMGVNALWLSPPNPQTMAGPPAFPVNDHGYWPSAHGQVDPALGGEAAMRDLVAEANKLGIEIAIDAVVNHFGYGETARINGKTISTSDPSYFIVKSDQTQSMRMFQELSHLMEHEREPRRLMDMRERLTQFPLYNLPTLRKDNPDVVNYLVESYKRFVDMGVTTFRLDAAKHIPQEFLKEFTERINAHSIQRRGKPAKFLWEVYMADSASFATFVRTTLADLKQNGDTFFYDFPMNLEFKRLQSPSYSFAWLAGFVKFREESKQPTDRYIPIVEDHDDGLPIADRFIARLTYAATEFFSRNSTFIFNGSEASGHRTSQRPVVRDFNESGDVSNLIRRISTELAPYRTNEGTKSVFHVATQDTLLAEKRLDSGRSLFFAANKSDHPVVLEVSTEEVFGRKTGIRLTRGVSVGHPSTSYDPARGVIWIMLPPKSLTTFEGQVSKRDRAPQSYRSSSSSSAERR